MKYHLTPGGQDGYQQKVYKKQMLLIGRGEK